MPIEPRTPRTEAGPAHTSECQMAMYRGPQVCICGATTESRTPRTEAGRRLLRQPHGPHTLDAILAIEAEAAAAPPIDVERLAAEYAARFPHGDLIDFGRYVLEHAARLSGPPSGGTDE